MSDEKDIVDYYSFKLAWDNNPETMIRKGLLHGALSSAVRDHTKWSSTDILIKFYLDAADESSGLGHELNMKAMQMLVLHVFTKKDTNYGDGWRWKHYMRDNEVASKTMRLFRPREQSDTSPANWHLLELHPHHKVVLQTFLERLLYYVVCEPTRYPDVTTQQLVNALGLMGMLHMIADLYRKSGITPTKDMFAALHTYALQHEDLHNVYIQDNKVVRSANKCMGDERPQTLADAMFFGSEAALAHVQLVNIYGQQERRMYDHNEEKRAKEIEEHRVALEKLQQGGNCRLGTGLTTIE